MTWVPFIDADPNNPPKCLTCNDYGGLFDDETFDPKNGLPHEQSCPECLKEEYDRN